MQRRKGEKEKRRKGEKAQKGWAGSPFPLFTTF
jgi:hypothetical protein